MSPTILNFFCSSPDEEIIQEDLTVQSAKTQLLKRFPSDLIESSVDPDFTILDRSISSNSMVRVYQPPSLSSNSSRPLPTSASSPSVNGLQVSVAQCGNSMIFLTLRFYVKSILAIFKGVILTHLEALNFDVDDCLGFFEG